MKKIKSKTLLSFGVVATLAASESVILSCGSFNQNQISSTPNQLKNNEHNENFFQFTIRNY